MTMEARTRRITSMRLIIGLALLVDLWALVVKIQQAYGVGSMFGHFSGSRLLNSAPLLLLAAIEVLLLWQSFTQLDGLLKQADSFLSRLCHLGKANWIFVFTLAILYPVLRFTPASNIPARFATQPFIFVYLLLAGVIFLMATGWRGFSGSPTSAGDNKTGVWSGQLIQCLAASLLIFSAVYQVAAYLPDTGRETGVTNYPLTLNGYSEASRYYFASLFFAESQYGIQASLPVLHPSRYLLQSLPFIFTNLPIWAARLWQVLLWFGLTLAGAALFARRLRLSSKAVSLAVTGWAFLFFFQGPIYYHLMVCAILVLWGFDSQRIWRSALVVGVASIWAGISRINWFPVPGLLAALLYILEQPSRGKSLIQYWLKPLVWAAFGLGLAYATSLGYEAISGNPKYLFNSSLTSSLLVYRLWPNVTYGPGIVLALLATIAPLSLLILFKAFQNRSAWNPLRWIGIASILAVLLVGGLVVSIKIGGGSNLHNMDSFLLLLAILGGYLFFNRMVPDDHGQIPVFQSGGWFTRVTLALTLFFPSLFLITNNLSVVVRNDQAIDQGLVKLQSMLDQATPQGKEILFISERQLVTFHLVHGVRLTPDYEMTFLMEMSMANNQRYFQAFDQDLKNHRFSLIITYPVGETLQDQNSLFHEENNAYVTHVNKPLLEYYQARTVITGLNLQVLVPKS